ncbi:MAG: aspartate/glutamate racemase family protein [Alphaproteobacteria bacterium]|nr:aspartate/glutamate racemase family protein [Alphaproteobacteria bacterium]
MHLGLIGGIGPAATVVYYQRLVAAFRARGRVLELTIANADVQTLARNAAADDRQAQAEIYARHLAQLKGAGADVGTITSIGGHFCYAETEAISPLPLVSAITPIDAGLAARGIRTIGLLGTRQVMGSSLYGQLERTRAIAPVDIEAVHEAYVGTATSGICTPEARALFFSEGARLIERGADAVLLAGTDLGLAFDGHEPGYEVIDALDLHVDHLVELATGEADRG